MITAAAATIQRNPFPGLRPFREEEEYLFFGRENQVDAMVDKLAATHFLAVVGTSGSGKSSLVNCGLRPALHGGLMARAGTAWRMAQFRPGSDPLGAMARALAQDGVLFRNYQADGLTLAEIVDTTLRMSKLGLIDIFEQAQLGQDVNLLLVVDQFEELFRYRQLRSGEDERVSNISEETTAFVNLLLEAGKQTTHPIYVVLTMRSDFLGDCAHFGGLSEAINAGQYLVPRMTRDERRAAISGPVGVGGAEIAPVLLTRLVNDVGDNPDQLSILQHALNRTWAHWENEGGGGGGPLDLAHYQAIGSMAHALDQHAEKAYAELGTARRQQICEKLFQALTDKATDPRGIRRPTTLGILCAVADTTDAEVTEVIGVFRKPSRSFLMPPAGEPLKPETVIDISHESLMRVWKRLNGWATEEAESVVEYLRLADSARRWKDGRAEMLQGRELDRAEEWRQDQSPTLAWAERYDSGFAQTIGYLDESRQVDRNKKRRARQARWTFRAAVALTCVILAGITIVALREQHRADGLHSNGQELLARSYRMIIGQEAGSLSPYEIESLWDLALLRQEDHRVRELFLEYALQSEENARQLQSRIDVVAHALIGLNDENRKGLLPIVRATLEDPKPSEAMLAAAQFYPYLIRGDDADDHVAAAVIDALVKAVQDSKKQPELQSKLVNALGNLGAQLSEENLEKLTAAIQTEKLQGTSVVWPAKGHAGLRSHLPNNSADAPALDVAGALVKAEDVTSIVLLAEALETLSKGLSETASNSIANEIVKKMNKEKENEEKDSSLRLARLGEALGGLGIRLCGSSADIGAGLLVSKINNEKEGYPLALLVKSLGGLGERLSPETSATLAIQLISEMEKNTTDGWRLGYLGIALGRLGPRLPEPEARNGARLLMAEMFKEAIGEWDRVTVYILAQALQSVSARVSDSNACELASRLLTKVQKHMKAMDKQKDRTLLSYLCLPFESLGEHLTDSLATELDTDLVSAMSMESRGERSMSLTTLYRFAKALRGREVELEKDQAAQVAEALSSAIRLSRTNNQRHYLRLGLAGLASRLTGDAASARAAVEAILAINVTHGGDDKDLEFVKGGGEINGVSLQLLFEELTSVSRVLSAEVLVEILRGPLCVGKARVAILNILGEKTGGLFHEPHDLRLLSPDDVGSIPTEGKNLVIVANVNDRLHFKIFDAHGKVAVDWWEEESGSTTYAELEALRIELQDSWRTSEIPDAKKAKVLKAATSFFGHSVRHDIWTLVEQAEEHGLNLKAKRQRPDL